MRLDLDIFDRVGGGDSFASGLIYGWRVDGPWAPARGQRFNPAKLLVDPCATALAGGVTWHPSLNGAEAGAQYAFGRSAANLTPQQAALMVAILPNPVTRRARNPTPGIRNLAAHYVGRARNAPKGCAFGWPAGPSRTGHRGDL